MRNSRLNGFIALYMLFLAIGSLYPLHGWKPLTSWSADFLGAPWPRYITRTDLATNLLAYAPLGYALAIRFSSPGRRLRGVVLSAFGGLFLSFSMESGQLLLPSRIASNLDILVNSLGTLTGALLSMHHGRWLRARHALHHWRDRWFQAGLATNIGLVLLILWLLTQLALLPFPGMGWLELHLRPIDTPPEGLEQINILWFAAVFLEITTMGTFAANLLRPGRYVSAMLLLTILAFIVKLMAATILLKLKVVGGVLSLETLSAFFLGFWFLLNPLVSRHRRGAALLLLSSTLVLRFFLSQHHIWPGTSLLNIVGLAKASASAWPYLALAYLLLASTLRGKTKKKN